MSISERLGRLENKAGEGPKDKVAIDYLWQLLNALSQNLDPKIERSYQEIREIIISDTDYLGFVPSLIEECEDQRTLWKARDVFFERSNQTTQSDVEAWITGQLGVLRHRDEQLYRQSLLQKAQNDENRDALAPTRFDSGLWTGIQSPAQRVAAVKALVPDALQAIDLLFIHLNTRSHNGGPPLESTEEAIGILEKLRDALNEILEAAKSGRLEEVGSVGLPAQAISYARRLKELFKDDPMPFAVAAVLVPLLGAAGFDVAAGVAATLAQATMKKSKD